MPDFTYHPLFKPLLFRLSAEAGRRITLGLLDLQGKTAAGRALFRAFARAKPPAEAKVRAFGLRFPSPIGLAPGIAIDGTAAPVLQYLGFGFLVLGPAGAVAVPPRGASEPLRVPERHAIVQSSDASAPAVNELLAKVRGGPPIDVPIGVALRGEDLAHSAAAAAGADFLVLPSRVAHDEAELARVRAATKLPVLVRFSPEWDDADLDRAIDRAIAARLDGCVAVEGAACPILPGGAIEGPFLLERAIATTEYVSRRAGDALPVVGSGGVLAPEDAVRLLDAGARLVELGAGFVYAGPGLPKRALTALLHRETPRPIAPSSPIARRHVPLAPRASEPPPESHRAPFVGGWLFLFATALVLCGSGIGALFLAATVQLLPNDVRYLGMTVHDLCALDACKIVHFMAHDRVSWGGSILSIGILYLWLAAVPARRGEAWAWWTFLLSGALGFASFLTYLGFGYLDRWHAAATLLLLPIYVLGLAWSWMGLRGDRRLRSILRSGARAWIWSPAGMGRACLTFSAFGMIAGGLTIMAVGMTSVFVPTDLEYMGVGVADIAAVSPRLIPLIAHDRAGFGGGLCSGGVAVMLTLWCGARPSARGLWLALTLSGIVGFGCAIGVHPIVGYTSFLHLLPAYLGTIAFVAGVLLLRKPMLDADVSSDRFPDV